MSIQLRKIEKFEKDVVDFIKKHPEAYNGVENLTEGVTVPDDLYLYNICDGEQTVGFFEIIKVGKDEFEIEIGVYTPRRGYARDCLSRFRELTKEDIDWNDKIILANIELSNKIFLL